MITTAQTLHWQVPTTHPVFAGHFPGQPIVPGVMLLDRAVLLCQQLTGVGDTLRQTLWQTAWQVSTAKFLRPVEPGTALCFEFKPGRQTGLHFRIYAASAPEQDVASGVLQPLVLAS
jgi:3-hydroxymyristoyl/3-hydroxydecanoyl-(acyl carrier protein) dehydratase